MPYNDDQLFYAALWWATSLDGAEAYTDETFKAYGKKPIALTPVKNRNDDYDGPPVTREQFKVFFETLYRGLKYSLEKEDFTTNGSGKYMKLERSASTSSQLPMYPDHPYSDMIESAIAASRIDRQLPLRGNRVFMHDNGQIFVTKIENERYMMAEVDYPGRPQLDYASHPNFRQADMKDTQLATWETFFRVVPLEEAQEYKWVYMAVDGKRYAHESSAAKNEVLIVGNYQTDVPLDELTDEEIINAGPRIRGNLATAQEEYVPGYVGDNGRRTIEATGDPRVVRDLMGPVIISDVTAKMALFTGSSFVIAEPGDKIIVEKDGYTPRVMRKEDIDSGKVKFIPYQPAQKPAPAPKMPAN